MSRLLGWQIENFMSIEKAKIEFDDNNIVNIKGYNDSGKSATLTALKVLLFNAYPTKQVSFIQDGKDYFRVLAVFDDGVIVLRDKYINGQSLYELHKGNKCLFSTKQNGVLTKVAEVPKIIQDYLGLIEYNGNYLNARSCFEKQIGVETTGSENYKMFNTVLKSEEISQASENINTDKNKVVNTITSLNAQIDANKQMMGKGAYLTNDIMDYLKKHDNLADLCELQEKELVGIESTDKAIKDIPNLPQIDEIDCRQLEILGSIETLQKQIADIQITPEVKEVDNTQITELQKICNMAEEIKNTVIQPEVEEVDGTQLTNLQGILTLAVQLSQIMTDIKSEDDRLKVLSNELDKMQKEVESLGVKLVKCPDCGCMFDPSDVHNH